MPPIKTTPPIKDTNKDGFLNGKEILEALKFEREHPNAPQRAHGILKTIKTTGLGMLVKLAPETLDSETLNELIETHIAEAQTEIKKGVSKTAFIKKATQKENTTSVQVFPILGAEAEILEDLSEFSEPKAMKVKSLKSAGDLYDLAATFKNTFPNGIKIEEEVMPELLERLGLISPNKLKLADNGGLPIQKASFTK